MLLLVVIYQEVQLPFKLTMVLFHTQVTVHHLAANIEFVFNLTQLFYTTHKPMQSFLQCAFRGCGIPTAVDMQFQEKDTNN